MRRFTFWLSVFALCCAIASYIYSARVTARIDAEAVKVEKPLPPKKPCPSWALKMCEKLCKDKSGILECTAGSVAGNSTCVCEDEK